MEETESIQGRDMTDLIAEPPQESQRYVEYGKTRNFDSVLPGSIENSDFKDRYLKMAAHCEKFCTEVVRANIPKEDARHILPGGITSEIVISANLREFRHLSAVRRHPRALREIRRICLKMLEMMKAAASIVFDDFEIDRETESVRIVEL
jgi:thymidylate synthase (FAD)